MVDTTKIKKMINDYIRDNPGRKEVLKAVIADVLELDEDQLVVKTVAPRKPRAPRTSNSCSTSSTSSTC